jgi:glycosyltransferase involved in cell wall biosynthesis
VVGNVAAISPMKGHRTFIRAAAALRTTHPNTRFVILGSTHLGRDGYYDSLWNEARGLGLELGRDLIVRDPKTEVSLLAQSFDLFWMTSEPRSEGIPTVIGEAKALGLPVVTTDVGSTSECVTDGVSGFVVPARDWAAIAEKSRVILADRSLRDTMSERSRNEALRDYASERGAAQHKLAFERALAHHRRSTV